MKQSDTRNIAQPTEGNRKARSNRGDANARTVARIRTAAAIVRHRQEWLYDRLADRFRIAFQEGVDKSRASVDVAAEKAREQLTAAGALTAQQGQRLKAFLIRDFELTATELRAAGKSAAEHLHPARVGAGALSSLATVFDSVGDKLQDFALRADEALAYKTGEVTSAGTLTCVKCKATLHFKQTGTVPPCPSCAATQFHKGY